MDEDTHLMMKVKKGDEEAYMNLFRSYSPRLAGFLMRNGASREIAEDLVQESFLRVWRERNNFTAKGTFKSWVYKITLNLYINEYKKKKRESLVEDSFFVNISHSSNTEREQDFREKLEKIKEGFLSLSPDERMALNLVIEGVSYSEGARTMGVSLSAFKTYVFRARNKLRKKVFFREREGENEVS